MSETNKGQDKSKAGRTVFHISMVLILVGFVYYYTTSAKIDLPDEVAEKQNAADIQPTQAPTLEREEPALPAEPPAPAAPTAQADNEPQLDFGEVPIGGTPDLKITPPVKRNKPTRQEIEKEVQKRLNVHGNNPILRVKRTTHKNATKQYVIHEPVWDQPTELTFKQLDANFQYFTVAGDFHPQGLPVVNGGAVVIGGAIMPIDPVGNDGELKRFWLANPSVVAVGCVFCNPPTMADLVYVSIPKGSVKVDREELYGGILHARVLGRFLIGSVKRDDGVEYMYELMLKHVAIQ